MKRKPKPGPPPALTGAAAFVTRPTRPVLVLDADNYRAGPPPWDAALAAAFGAERLPTEPVVLTASTRYLPGPVVRHTLEDLDELDEGWARGAELRAYGDPHERTTATLEREPDMPAMRRPRPRDGASVDTGQFSKRKTDK